MSHIKDHDAAAAAIRDLQSMRPGASIRDEGIAFVLTYASARERAKILHTLGQRCKAPTAGRVVRQFVHALGITGRSPEEKLRQLDAFVEGVLS